MRATTPTFKAQYLDGRLGEFFELAPGDTGAALARNLDRPRAELASALRSEAERLGAPAAAFESIERLAHPASRVVVAGQQPGLLLGPAYTLSKAVSAIRLARSLDSEAAPVVPVFWVASQDHDTAEVDHAELLDLDERLHRIALPLPPEVPSGLVPFDPTWTAVLRDELRKVGGRPEHLASVVELLEDAGERAETFADHFASLLYRLLGEEGLVVLDPVRPAVAPFFAPVLRRELARPRASVDAIIASGEELRLRGLEPQLGRGRDATNLFLCETVDGRPVRQLLRYDGRVFRTIHRAYDRAELEELLCTAPARLTPAAGLRPVTQDAVLPTAAFVVGPGELAYLAQLRGVYELHDVAMPLVWPRAECVVLEPPVRRIMDRYELDHRTYAGDPKGCRERVLLDLSGHGDTFARALARLEEECARLVDEVRFVDPTLERTVERSEARIERTIDLLRSKAAAALERRDSTVRRQFERLDAQLFPGGVPQERLLSPFSFFLKFGLEPMMALYRSMGESGEFILEP